MVVDILLVACLAGFAVSGYRSGTLRQLAQWSGIAIGRLVAKPLALVMTLALAPRLGFPPVGARVALSVFCFYTFSVIGTFLTYFVFKKIARRHHHSRLDRIGGGVLSVGKGVLLLYVAVAVVIFFEEPRIMAAQRSPGIFGRSASIEFIRDHNPFAGAQLPPAARVAKLIRASRDPAAARRLSRDPRMRELLLDPRLKASLQDQALAKALAAGDWSAVERDPRISALLADPRFAAALADPLDSEQ